MEATKINGYDVKDNKAVETVALDNGSIRVTKRNGSSNTIEIPAGLDFTVAEGSEVLVISEV